MKTIHTGHGTYRLEYHVCWITKYRRRILNPGVQSYIRKLFPKILGSMPGVEIHQIGMDIDHLHMVITIPPKYSIAVVISQIKSLTASNLRKKFSWLKKVYWKENIVWSPGYFVSSVGLNETTIKNYVKYQGAQDSSQIELDL